MECYGFILMQINGKCLVILYNKSLNECLGTVLQVNLLGTIFMKIIANQSGYLAFSQLCRIRY